jgi:hypothetical protein
MKNNENVDLIRKMLSLVESTNNSIKSKINEESSTEEVEVDSTTDEVEVDEQVTSAARGGAEVLASVLAAEKGLFSTIKSELSATIPALKNYNNADDLIKALEGGKLGLQDSFKIVKQSMKVPEIAQKMRGLLSDSKAFQEMSKLVYPKGISQAADPKKFKLAQDTLMKSYGMSADDAAAMIKRGAEKAGSSGGVTTRAVDKAIARRTPDPSKLKSSSPEVSKFVNQNVVNPAEEVVKGAGYLRSIGDAGAKLAERVSKQLSKFKPDVFKKLQNLKGRLNAKQLALYGLAGYGIYELLKGAFTGEDGKNTNGVIPACVANLEGAQFVIGTGDVAVVKIEDGIDEKSKGHGGLFFWPNGRAITGDNQVRGNYYCKGTSGGPSDLSAKIQEQASSGTGKYSNIHVDWDGEKKTDDTKPNPNPKPKPSLYKPCKDFDFAYGCQNDLIREMQVCLNLPKNLQTGNYGPKTKEALSEAGYDLSKGITKQVYEAVLKNCSGKGTENKITRLPNLEPIKTTGIRKIDTSLSNMSIKDLELRIKPLESTPEQVYERIKSAGLIFGEDGNNRIKYKGPTPDGAILDKLDTALEGMGYTRIKTLEDMKRYGSKYVWLLKK